MLRYNSPTLEEVFLDIARGRDRAAQRPRRQEHCPDLDVHADAAGLHLLSGDGAAALAGCVAWTLPPTYVFEGMRSLLIDHEFRADLMIAALAINAVLLVASFAGFLALLRNARRHGSLIQSGE
jgi:hypothetical protein